MPEWVCTIRTTYGSCWKREYRTTVVQSFGFQSRVMAWIFGALDHLSFMFDPENSQTFSVHKGGD